MYFRPYKDFIFQTIQDHILSQIWRENWEIVINWKHLLQCVCLKGKTRSCFFQLTFQSNDLEFTAMLLFSSQCAIAHVKMSDKLGASFDAWEKKMFFIPSTHIFSEYFSSYSSGGFDLTLFFFWFEGWKKKRTYRTFKLFITEGI